MSVKSISASDLRIQIKQVLNEVGYGQAEYVVEKFGEPIAAVISMQDYRQLQALKQAAGAVDNSGSAFTHTLQTIRETLQASGYQTRSKAEIDADLEAERGSWDTE